MRRALPLFFAAVLMPCGAAACLCALALAATTPAQSATNTSGNMNRAARPAPRGETPAPNSDTNTDSNSNSNSSPGTNPATDTGAAGAPNPRRPPAPPAVRWEAPGPVRGFVADAAPVLRDGASASARVIGEIDTGEYPRVEMLEVEGDFVRVRFETEGEGGRPRRSSEGWVSWGEVLPATTALVLDARSGRILRRVALGPGIDCVAFSPDGRRALYHGRWAENVYEADASDLVPTRRLRAEGEGTFGPAAYTGGQELLVPFWSLSVEHGLSSTTPHVARADDGGGVSAAPFAASPAGSAPASIAFSPDARTGFAFYTYPYGDEDELPAEEDRGPVATVEVFDPSTMQTTRRFKLPDPALSFDHGSLAFNADGSELYLFDHPGQRLAVIETQTGGVVREVSLAGETQRWFGFVRPTAGDAGTLIHYWEQSEGEHRAGPHPLRLDGWRAVPDASGFTFTADAAGTLYAVDDNGTRLFTLDAEGRPRSERELRRGEDYQVPVGLFATPDGPRLVLLLSAPEHGC